MTKQESLNALLASEILDTLREALTLECPCLGNPKIAFHGTQEPEVVLREGILQRKSSYADGCIYLARRPDGATAFGTVIQVDLTGIEGSFSNDWQTHIEQDISPERLSLWDGKATALLLCDACWERVSMTSPGEGPFHLDGCSCSGTGRDPLPLDSAHVAVERWWLEGRGRYIHFLHGSEDQSVSIGNYTRPERGDGADIFAAIKDALVKAGD